MCAGAQGVAETVLLPHGTDQVGGPAPERLQRRQRGQQSRHRVDELIDVELVDGQDERLTGRVVAVQGAGPDAGPLGDLVLRGAAVFGEGLPRGGQDTGPVLASVGTNHSAPPWLPFCYPERSP